MKLLWSLAMRRSLDGRGLLALATLGIVVAAVLLASAPIYGRAMADLGLRFKVRDEVSTTPVTRLEFSRVALNTTESRAFRAAMERRLDERLGWFTAGGELEIRMNRLGVRKAGVDFGDFPPHAVPYTIAGMAGHVRIVGEGRLPGVTAPGEPFEAAIGVESSNRTGLKPGDRVRLVENFDTCEREPPTDEFPPPPPPPCPIRATITTEVEFLITAVIEPIHRSDPIWLSQASRYFDPQTVQLPGVGPVVGFYVDERALVDGVGAVLPSYLAAAIWRTYADPEALDRGNFRRAKEDIVGLGAEVEGLGGAVISPLPAALDRFDQSARFQQAPLAILLLEISAVAVFYVIIVATLIVERQTPEIGLLRSRGASRLQVIGVYLIQGLMVGVPAALLAPFLAVLAVAGVGLLPVFDDVTGGDALPVRVPLLAFPMAGAGALLGLLALILPALVATASSTLALRRAESRPGGPLLQRYYLDIALAGAAGLLLFELDQRDSVFTPSATGGVSSDPLLLASPALIIAAAAALILRLYPLVLGAGARAVSLMAGAPLSLSFAQLVRNAGQHTRLTLLMMMAVAVGTFAGSYATTTDRSYEDRARYETGADLRASYASGTPDPLQPPPKPSEMERIAADIPGVERATAVVRVSAGVASAGSTRDDLQLLGIDPRGAEQLLWLRRDFGDALRALPERLPGSGGVGGVEVPAGSRELSIQLKGNAVLGSINFWGRLRASNGQFLLVEFGELNTGGQWQERRGRIREDELHPGPFTLVSFIVSEPSNRFLPNLPAFFIDNLTAHGSTSAVIDDFEGNGRWTTFPSRQPTPDSFAVVAEGAFAGRGSGRFSFGQGGTNETRGLYTTTVLTPLPILASTSSGLVTGAQLLLRAGTGSPIPVLVRGTFDLFPTTTTAGGPVVLMNRESLIGWQEVTGFVSEQPLLAAELLVEFEPGATETTRLAISKELQGAPYGFHEVLSLAETLKHNRANPLIAASGTGILVVAFAAVLGLVAVALLVSLLAAVRKRRVELAVIRALGFTRGQLLRMLAVEYVVTGAIGVAAGTILGRLVAMRMLSFLDATEDGTRLEPSFILATDWALVASAVAVVTGLVAVTLVAVTLRAARTADPAALRTE